MRKKAASDNEATPRKNNDLFQKRQLQILKKATKLFTKKGYAQTSMREISKATGIDISNLYYFIKSKEEILFRVFEMIHRPEIELFEKQEIMGIDDPLEQLRTVIRGLLDFGYDYGEEILLLYRESKVLPKSLRKIILSRESDFVAQIEEILKKGLERKVFYFEDASFTANMIVYELSLHPLRNWNLKKYSKKELINLLEKHVMKAVMI
jgi:TetR/AcrR family transcriptional regulator, cholesterol catabolism regulator